MVIQRLKRFEIGLFVALLFQGAVRLAPAQTPRDSTASFQAEAKRLFSRADTLALGSVSDKRAAVDLLRQAAGQYSKGGARREAVAMLRSIGRVFSAMGQLDSAMAYFRQALPMARAVGDLDGEADALGEIGRVFRRTGRPDSAMAYYRQALSIFRLVGDRADEGVVLNNIGTVFRNIGQPDSAMAYYHQALPIRRAVGDQIGEAVTLNNIGTIFSDLAQLDSALAYYRQALPIRRAVGDRNGEATTLGNIGDVFGDVGQQDSALAYQRQALPIRRAVGDRIGEAIALNRIGAAFRQPDSALAFYRQALAIRHAVGDRSGEAGTLNDIGLVFYGIGQSDSALSYYRRTMTLTTGDRAGDARTLHNIGNVFRRIGQGDSAQTYYRRALPILHATGDRGGEANTLLSVGGAYRDIGRLDSAIVYFDRSTALSSGISRHTGSDFNQLSYNETTTDTYARWTLTWLALASHGEAGKGSGPATDSVSAANGALAASERGRAQGLLDLMRDTAARVEPGADFPAEGARLAATLRRSNSAGLVYLSTGDTTITWLISSNGNVKVFRRAIARDTLAALIGAFRKGLVEETESDRLVPRGAMLEAGADRGFRKGSAGAWRRRAHQLSTILLPPEVLRALSKEKEVVIIPQGTLSLVPFAGLPVGDAGEPFGAKLAIRYAPSLATLGQAEERPGLGQGEGRDRTLMQALVVGNPTMPEVRVSDGTRNRLASLPGAEAESRGIATQLGTSALTGTQATETEVVRRLANAPVVHLATHGFAYSTEAKARSSFVALAPDSLNDGLLTVGNILDNSRLKIIADLVVLSACQTALGDLKQAEGTVGLQRAFLAKGARSVLVSLWNVSDAATRILMMGFYRHWLRDPDHPTKAEALRRSQEEVRNTPGFEHPRFWAAFQLVGAG
jgi:CHAT domain-containing protein/tetratricopeptide (TPR) repeat protein